MLLLLPVLQHLKVEMVEVLRGLRSKHLRHSKLGRLWELVGLRGLVGLPELVALHELGGVHEDWHGLDHRRVAVLPVHGPRLYAKYYASVALALQRLPPAVVDKGRFEDVYEWPGGERLGLEGQHPE